MRCTCGGLVQHVLTTNIGENIYRCPVMNTTMTITTPRNKIIPHKTGFRACAKVYDSTGRELRDTEVLAFWSDGLLKSVFVSELKK